MTVQHPQYPVFLLLAIAAVLLMPGRIAGQVNPAPLPGSSIPQFVDALPLLSVSGGSMQTVTSANLEVRMCEFKASVLPTGTPLAAGADGTTHVWGYYAGSTCPSGVRDTFIGPVIVATRGVPTEVKWINELGSAGASHVVAYTEGSDQTFHWADPLNDGANHCAHMGGPATGVCAQHYSGAIAATPHLHGGEVPPVVDGGPSAWFTSDGSHHGYAFYSKDGNTAGNYAIYRYPNTQEAGNLWFHDHTLGVTRLGVYAGLAGAYPLVDPGLQLPAGLDPIGLRQVSAGQVDYLIPLVIQDRMFYDNGELLIPHVGLNPEHPYWVPEFVGDANLVNGKVWPFLNVEPRRYRFLIINGSNARAYELSLDSSGGRGVAMWQIGTDGGYLDAPVPIGSSSKSMNLLVLMPGERADIIIDFSTFAGKNLILRNSGRHPFPGGTPPQGSTLGRVMQFRVAATSTYVPDTSYDPASGIPIRSGSQVIQRLVNTAAGSLNVAPDKVRQLTLNEVMGPGGPLEILVNNTKWSGMRPPSAGAAMRDDFTAVTIGGVTEYYSETPREGQTEAWEIVNLTADAHPIHTHLTQVQLINRQRFNVSKYSGVYGAAFPGGGACAPGVFCPAFGPPLTYAPSAQSGNKYGGNPSVDPWLQGYARPPEANEAGWKDTIIAYPGEVMRIAVRYAPQDTPVGTNANNAYYPFDPQAGGRGFVFHCHIIDHEDNEMMRPLLVERNPNASRSFTDY